MKSPNGQDLSDLLLLLQGVGGCSIKNRSGIVFTHLGLIIGG
jgi:hypothetical protein